MFKNFMVFIFVGVFITNVGAKALSTDDYKYAEKRLSKYTNKLTLASLNQIS